MSFLEEFQASIDSLPNILQKKYSVLRDLDKSLQDIQRQNEQRCEQEIEDIKKEVKSGNITPDTSLIRFSDAALDEQRHSLLIADEKVSLAVQVDTHIQQLDQYLKKFDEELRRERDAVPASGLPAASLDGNVKSGRGSEGGKGGRKKTRLATAAAAAATETATTAATPTGMDLDLPVDPNEPTYCVCNNVSYGEMVACDNPTCKIEWFHFGCVGLREQPKGKWYCSECAVIKHRRKGR
ncbi:PHD finger protein ING1 isoform X2 [Ziziphus jujuba]|uniref:PHD finger protein ING n=1 Tax=Ziziphus jujuba TaxID=326968 RepID=A0ABM3IPB6_ZIZJJ|nr:PHD finger protein ING1 isoform X2 [Ziziphus jujuba]